MKVRHKGGVFVRAEAEGMVDVQDEYGTDCLIFMRSRLRFMRRPRPTFTPVGPAPLRPRLTVCPTTECALSCISQMRIHALLFVAHVLS